MKIFFKFFLLAFIIINLFIVFSGRSWLYKAITITYLKGYPSSYIHDFIHFSANTIKNGKHQEWLISKRYNTQVLPKFVAEINNELETVAFMVIQNDSIQYERYWHGYSADSMSNSFSMAKSWVSTLIGVAIKDGIIKTINQPVCDFLPEFCLGDNSKITIKHLLTMSSGLNWQEEYYNPIGQTAEAYYGDDLKSLMFSLEPVERPGKIFKYHSSCTQLLCFVIEKATKKSINEYASEKLWGPMGAKHPALWNTDSDGGDEKGFCCINSNARDFARLGRLYMNYGNWNGIQILDTSYIKNSTSATLLLDEGGDKNMNYGYHFWLAKYKNMSVYYARGLWGQYMICIPEKNMIIVRLGKKEGSPLDDGHRDDFYAFIDAALEISH